MTALQAQVERLAQDVAMLRAQLLVAQSQVQEVSTRSEGLIKTAVELARDVNVLQADKAWALNDQRDDYDDDIPGATRETSDDPPVLAEDVQISALGVSTALKLRFKGVAAKHLLGRVYAMRDLGSTDGADEDGWIDVDGARLLPAGVGGSAVEIPVWDAVADRWVSVFLTGADLLSLLGWDTSSAGLVLTGNGASAPTFQDIAVALGSLLGSETAGRVMTLVDVPGVGFVAQWASPAVPYALTPGAGLSGSAYDTLLARTWTLDFGDGHNQPARGDHAHSGFVSSLAAELAAAEAPPGAVLFDGSDVTAGPVMPAWIGYPTTDPIAAGTILMFSTAVGCRYTVPTLLTQAMGETLPFDSGVSAAGGLVLRMREFTPEVGPAFWGAQWEAGGLLVPVGGTAGNILVWDATAGAWVAQAPGRDVPVGGADGDILVWDATGEAWEAVAPPSPGTEVPVGTADGQLLVWNAGASEWRAVAPPSPSGATVPLGTETGEILVWDEAGGEWLAVEPDAKEALTPGTGLSGSAYDTALARTWSVDFGTGTNQVARGDHGHAAYSLTSHGHDYKAGLEAQFSGVVPTGIMVYMGTGAIWALAKLTPDLVKSGAAGNAGRVMAFGASDTDTGTLYDLAYL
ncbi:MAG: hypothetical protein WCR06_04785, partial [bacterium]